jgi:alkanesulfonate monooxygenase SsuD/methylene tetrahydromethanopterin reductase-like flavin-dependent oxidoreductase (luciferase family)
MTLGEAPWHSSERRSRLGEALAIIDQLFREQTASYEGQYYCVRDATLFPGPVQQPRPRLTIAAHGPKSIEQAARYADEWNTAGLYWSLDPRSTTPADMLRLTRTRIEQLENAARYAGRNPAEIERSILVGWEWPVATARPWDSVEAFREFVGTYQLMGFTEFIGPEPATLAETETLERVAGEVLPALRAGG